MEKIARFVHGSKLVRGGGGESTILDEGKPE